MIDESSVGAGPVDTDDHPADGLPVTTAYRRANQVAGLIVAALGGAMTFGGLNYGLMRVGVPGPGLFPVIIGSMLFVLGLSLVGVATLGKLDRSDDTLMPDRVGIRRILLTVLATAVFIWALAWIGYMLAMTLYVLVLLVYVGGRRLLNSVIIAVVFGFGSFAVFTYGLGLQLPHSALPFLHAIGL